MATGKARSAAASPNGPFEAALLNDGGPNLLLGGAAAAIIASCSLAVARLQRLAEAAVQ